jgi:hypothetical protein
MDDLKSIQNRSDRDPTPRLSLQQHFYFDSLPQLLDSLLLPMALFARRPSPTILAEKFSRLADAAYNLALNLFASNY